MLYILEFQIFQSQIFQSWSILLMPKVVQQKAVHTFSNIYFNFLEDVDDSSVTFDAVAIF